MDKKYIYYMQHFTLTQFLIVSVVIAFLIYFLNIFIILSIPILAIIFINAKDFDDNFFGYFWYGIFFILVHVVLVFFYSERLYYARKDEIFRISYAVATINSLSFSVFIQLVLKYLNIFFIQNNSAVIANKITFLKRCLIRLFLCILCVFWTSLCVVYALDGVLNPKSSHFIRKTERRIDNIGLALMSYSVDYGNIPPHIPNLYSSKPLIIYLDGNPLNGGSRRSYFDFHKDELAEEKVIDPFGGEIHYRIPTNPDGSANPEIANKEKFDLWSEGEITKAMGDIHGRDDIRNWEVPSPPSPIISYAFFCWILLVIFNIAWFYLAQKIFYIPHEENSINNEQKARD